MPEEGDQTARRGGPKRPWITFSVHKEPSESFTDVEAAIGGT